MKKLLAVFMALSLGAFVFADEVTTEETEVVASETSENADGDESKEEKKEEKAPYVSPAEFGRIYFSNKLYEDDAFMYKINDDSEFDKDSFPETDIPAIKDEWN